MSRGRNLFHTIVKSISNYFVTTGFLKYHRGEIKKIKKTMPRVTCDVHNVVERRASAEPGRCRLLIISAGNRPNIIWYL